MKMSFFKYYIALTIAIVMGCADNEEGEKPLDDNFPFQIVLDADEGGDLADAEEYSVELKFADYLPDLELPNTPITLVYTITDLEGDMIGNVSVDKVVYEVEVDDCVYERELEFTSDGSTGVITIAPDTDLGSVPESFEVVFALPAFDATEGSFKVEFSSLESSENLLLGSPNVFEYSVLDNDVAGEWEMEISSEEEFESFREIFAPLNATLEDLTFEDITGNVTAEFEFGEMKFVLELIETEEVTTCENGDTETEEVNKVIEIEAEYEAEDDEIEWEGSHEILNDDGLAEDELDFIMEGSYERSDEVLILSFLKVIDEDNFDEGEELFKSDEGVSFTFEKD